MTRGEKKSDPFLGRFLCYVHFVMLMLMRRLSMLINLYLYSTLVFYFQSCVFAFVTSGVACLQQQQQKTDVFSEISGQWTICNALAMWERVLPPTYSRPKAPTARSAQSRQGNSQQTPHRQSKLTTPPWTGSSCARFQATQTL